MTNTEFMKNSSANVFHKPCITICFLKSEHTRHSFRDKQGLKCSEYLNC